MESPKARPASPDDRSVGPRLGITAHNGFVDRRAGGSPPESSNASRPMLPSCAVMGETQVWQSTSGATASMVVSVSGLSRPILWNDEDRNPRETQPGASY